MDLQLQTAQKIVELERKVETAAVPEKSIDLISPFMALPGLRGFWPMSAFDSGGNAEDQSGHGRTLTYNGNPTYNYTGLAPYIDLDGTGDYLSRADEADLDIIGTETYVAGATQGLTFGLWARPQATVTGQMVMGKADDTNGPYFLFQDIIDDALFRIRNAADAANFDVRITDGFLTTNVWALYVCRYIPSTEIKIWKNMETNTNVVGIPASILNGTDNFAIGANGVGTAPWEGDASLCFLCAAALSDAQISNLFQTTRAAFGV